MKLLVIAFFFASLFLCPTLGRSQDAVSVEQTSQNSQIEQNSCWQKFSTHRCQERIDASRAGRHNFLNCHDPNEGRVLTRANALRCLASGAASATAAAVAPTLIRAGAQAIAASAPALIAGGGVFGLNVIRQRIARRVSQAASRASRASSANLNQSVAPASRANQIGSQEVGKELMRSEAQSLVEPNLLSIKGLNF